MTPGAGLAAHALERLDQAAIRWVRIVWCDHASVIRAKAAHRRLLDDGLPEGVGISAAQLYGRGMAG